MGDKVRQADGTTGTVWLRWNVEKTEEMYNLTVDEAHTFFVGDGQWLVHNTCGPKWTFVGYHGSTTTHLESILHGINPPKPGLNFNNLSQLGPGFYTTKDLNVAKEFANTAKGKEIFQLALRTDLRTAFEMAPSSVIVEIYAKKFETMKGIGVLESAGWWSNFKPSLWQGYDYLQSPIDGYTSIYQTMFTSNVYDQLKAMLLK